MFTWYRNDFHSGMSSVPEWSLYCIHMITSSGSLRRSDSRGFRARSGTHAPLARRLHDLRFSIQNDVRFQFNDTRMKFRSRTRISFGMKTGMNSFRNKSHFRYHANSPLSFAELMIDAFDAHFFFNDFYYVCRDNISMCLQWKWHYIFFRLNKCFVFWQMSGILTGSIPVNWVDIVWNGTMGLLWGTNFAPVSCSTS